jgi:hypothetical protein
MLILQQYYLVVENEATVPEEGVVVESRAHGSDALLGHVAEDTMLQIGRKLDVAVDMETKEPQHLALLKLLHWVETLNLGGAAVLETKAWEAASLYYELQLHDTTLVWRLHFRMQIQTQLHELLVLVHMPRSCFVRFERRR